MIDKTTTTSTVSPRSDIFVERAGELAFQFAEHAAGLVLEVGAMIHAGRDAIREVLWAIHGVVWLQRPAF